LIICRYFQRILSDAVPDEDHPNSPQDRAAFIPGSNEQAFFWENALI
jgi:hypothetical protein